jgi:putative FmdB family regulatory protein
MPIYDFQCERCEHVCEDELCSNAEAEKGLRCPSCGGDMTRLMGAPRVFTTIIPTYPGSKRHKAGHVHKFANRPAEKTQIGYGGSVSADHPTGSTRNN